VYGGAFHPVGSGVLLSLVERLSRITFWELVSTLAVLIVGVALGVSMRTNTSARPG
jgi:hypothetical protein